MVKQYYDDIINHRGTNKGSGQESACVAGLCQNAYRRTLGKREDIIKKGIQVYSCAPGWVRTDMGGPEAPLSIEEAAVGPSMLVYLPWKINPEFQGKIFDQIGRADV